MGNRYIRAGMMALSLVAFSGSVHADDKLQNNRDLVGNTQLWQSFRAGMTPDELRAASKENPITKPMGYSYDSSTGLAGFRNNLEIMGGLFQLHFVMSSKGKGAKLQSVRLSDNGSLYVSPGQQNCAKEKRELFATISSELSKKYNLIRKDESESIYEKDGLHIKIKYYETEMQKPTISSEYLSSDILMRLYQIRSAKFDLQEAHCKSSELAGAKSDFQIKSIMAVGGRNVADITIEYTDYEALNSRIDKEREDKAASDAEQKEALKSSKQIL